MPKVVIIGGGILGLYAAHQLTKRDFDVTLLEKSELLGGAIKSYHIEGYDIEQFYHHFFTIDHDLIKFVKDLGLSNDILFNYAINGFYYQDQIYPLFRPTHLIGFKPLSLKCKIEFIKFMVRAKLVKDFKNLDEYTAKEWVTRVAGSSVYENFFKILLKSKFGKNHEKSSAAWFVERINLRSHVDKNGEKLGYLKGGFYQLVKILKNEILNRNGKILTGINVKEIVVKNNKAVCVKYDNKIIDCDYIISSIPPFILTKLVEFPKAYEHQLNQLEYQPAVCILLGLDKQITDKFYWATVMKDNNPFGAFIEHTNLVPKELYNDTILVYLASYVERNSKLMQIPEEEVFKIYFNSLIKMFPKINIKNVKWWRVSRDFNTGLIYKKGIYNLIPDIQTPIENIFIGGMFNSYPERSISKSVQLGAQIVNKILNSGS